MYIAVQKFLMKSTKHKQSGFTLIELLVVIAIIGLLSSIIAYSVNSVRKKSRDVIRVQDLQTLTKALEMYYQDNGTYPIPPGEFWATSYTDATYGWQNLQTALTPYITRLPRDPLANNSVMWSGPDNYGYTYGWVSTVNGRMVYSLVTNLESSNNPLRCEAQAIPYRWHWNGGVNICHNGGVPGWSYSVMGYQASASPP
jgi:type II secretion system protein G